MKTKYEENINFLLKIKIQVHLPYKLIEIKTKT